MRKDEWFACSMDGLKKKLLRFQVAKVSGGRWVGERGRAVPSPVSKWCGRLAGRAGAFPTFGDRAQCLLEPD